MDRAPERRFPEGRSPEGRFDERRDRGRRGAFARASGRPRSPLAGRGARARRRTLLLVEGDLRPQALRTHRRAKKESRPLDVALAAAELPFGRGTLSALVVENVAGLPDAEGERWIASLTPLLRPGGRLIAADATSSDEAAARVAGTFLAAALIQIVQEWPREGAVLTVGIAPAASVTAARFDFPV